jgi:hypothetical protein
MEINEISINDKKVVEFYKNNPQLDPTLMNIILVDLMEQLIENMDDTFNNTIQSKIMRSIESLSSQVHHISNTIDTHKSDISDILNTNLSGIQTQMVDEMKGYISSNQTENITNIKDYFQEQCASLIHNSNSTIENIIPKANQQFYSELQKCFGDFKYEILQTTSQTTVNTQEGFHKLGSLYSEKSSHFIQNIQQLITSSETRIQENLSSIQNDSRREQLHDQLQSFLGKYTNSTYKGQFGENQLEITLCKLYPSAEVINTTGMTAACDFHLKRKNKPTILVETKNYDKNVTTGEVRKFIRDIETRHEHGIFLSQHSGITTKQNFQIDFIGSQIAIYIHNVDYSPQLIKLAVDIIDNLHPKLELITSNKIECQDIQIEKEILEHINNEYQTFVSEKLSMIELCKTFNKDIMSKLDKMVFPKLDTLLKPHFSNVITLNNNILLCDICNTFEASNNRSLTRHKTSCLKKHSKIETQKTENGNDNDIIIT